MMALGNKGVTLPSEAGCTSQHLFQMPLDNEQNKYYGSSLTLRFTNNHFVPLRSSAYVSPDRNYPFINYSAPRGGGGGSQESSNCECVETEAVKLTLRTRNDGFNLFFFYFCIGRHERSTFLRLAVAMETWSRAPVVFQEGYASHLHDELKRETLRLRFCSIR